MVRQIEKEDGVLLFEDTIQGKANMDENGVMYWHYDHYSGHTVRRINLFNAMYHSDDISMPVAFGVIKKPLQFCDVQTTKNQTCDCHDEEWTDARNDCNVRQ